ncbi:chitin synthase-6 [Diaporthe helianthi]|uniref:chitin synthase n=1 Tax=Diaporthe helianthi TaxID=158607 RepID=A0A2P5I9G6_DIAHE|nr:chitin synthase-6 [Diaporthe helianthi]
MALSWPVKDIVYTSIVGVVMLAALLEWFLWIGAFLYCLWKVFRKSEHWTVNVLAVVVAVAFLLLRAIFLPIMIVTLPLPSQIVSYWPVKMVDFLLGFAFWSFAGLLTIPWLFCVYQLVTHQLGRTKRIKQLLDEDSAPKVVIVMPCYKEEPDVLITAIDSVVDGDYPPSCIHVFLSFDGDQEDELYLTTIERLGVPLTLESYPKSIDVAYKDARITVSRFPHGGKRNCQKATYKLIDRIYTDYLKMNDNLFILFIDSDCILDRMCLQNFLYDMEFSPGNQRNMLAMTGVITSTTKKHSIITLLQDMEYIHGQLFERSVESGCGSVTCLPGALTMLRFSAFRRMAKYYFAGKAEQCEDLFDFAKDHLGEDRYLTHLFMIGAKHRYQIQMCTSAFCKTEAVQTYASLVKQRRRWFLGFITNEACMLTDWRLWRRYPVLVLYRFCQNTIRTTALLFFVMVLALLSTEKSIADLPVGFIGVSLGLNWLMMIYFGAKLRRYKIWLYPMMFVLNPFFNWYYMVYGIFTAGQRTWGGPRADAAAADKNTTVQEAIEHAEQTGDDLNIKPETFIPAIMEQRQQQQQQRAHEEGDEEEARVAGERRRRRMSARRGDGLGRQRSVLQPPPQVEGLFAAPLRTEGGIYRYPDPGTESGGSTTEVSSGGGGAGGGGGDTSRPRVKSRIAVAHARQGSSGGRAFKARYRPEDIEMRGSSSMESSTMSNSTAAGTTMTKGKGVYRSSGDGRPSSSSSYVNGLRSAYSSVAYTHPRETTAAAPPPEPEPQPQPAGVINNNNDMRHDSEDDNDDTAFMNEEDSRKYEMAHARQAKRLSQVQPLHQPPAGPATTTTRHQQHMYQYEFPETTTAAAAAGTETGYAETLPGTPVHERSAEGLRDGAGRERSNLAVPARGSRQRGRSPLASGEVYVRVPFEDDGELEDDETASSSHHGRR